MKCGICRKNLIMEYNCKKCTKAFCIRHRLPEKHECSNYKDYKNDKVVLEKIEANKFTFS